jgi:hypothetical protein
VAPPLLVACFFVTSKTNNFLFIWLLLSVGVMFAGVGIGMAFLFSNVGGTVLQVQYTPRYVAYYAPLFAGFDELDCGQTINATFTTDFYPTRPQ